jgi:hypothetical protein
LTVWAAPGYFPVDPSDSDRAKVHNAVARSLQAYVAETTPALRTRAEVDAERLLNLDAWRASAISSTELCRRDSLLSAERVQDEY